MIVYHGTGSYNLDSLLSSKPRTSPRAYLDYRKAFSTTTDFEIAALFALRRSPPSILRGDESQAGVVLEYEFLEILGKGKKWTPAECHGVLQDEKEIAILKPEILEIRAVWKLNGGEWKREKVKRVEAASV